MVKRINTQKTEKYLYMPITKDRDQAVEAKIKLLQGRFFGKPVVKFQVTAMRQVWVPYTLLTYHLRAERGVFFKKGGLVKEGDAGVIFDLNEVHPMQYDLYETDGLPLVQAQQSREEYPVLPCKIRDNELVERAEGYLQDQVMKRFYGRTGQVVLQSRTNFLRPAVEMEVVYRQKNKNIRYAWLDDFGVQNEHILGLKYRVENNF